MTRILPTSVKAITVVHGMASSSTCNSMGRQSRSLSSCDNSVVADDWSMLDSNRLKGLAEVCEWLLEAGSVGENEDRLAIGPLSLIIAEVVDTKFITHNYKSHHQSHRANCASTFKLIGNWKDVKVLITLRHGVSFKVNCVSNHIRTHDYISTGDLDFN